MTFNRALIAAGAMFLAVSSAWGGSFNKVVGTGTAVPGQGTTFTGVNIAGVDAAMGTAFIGSFTLGGQSYSGLYNASNNLITPLVDRNTVGPAGETFNSIIANGDYENGVIVFAANTSAGQAIYRYTPGVGLSALVRQGDVLPGSTSPVASFYNRGVAGDANEYAFGTVRADATRALYTTVDGFFTLSADDKTRAPVAEMGNFIAFPEIHYRNGHTAFVGTGMDPDDDTAQPEAAGVFYMSPGNPTDVIAGRNYEIPGGSGFRFREFERPRIMPDGRVAFAGGFIDEEDPDPSAPHHMGVFIRNPDQTWKKYIDSEMFLPGLHAETHEFNQYSLESGWNFFGVNDIAGGSYIYYESAEGVFTHLIDSYELLDGKTINRIRMLSDTAVGSEVFFRVDFMDGSSGIYTSTVPEPAAMSVAGLMTLLGLSRRVLRRK